MEGRFGFHLSACGGAESRLKIESSVDNRGAHLIYSAVDFPAPCGPNIWATEFAMDSKGNPYASRVPYGGASTWQVLPCLLKHRKSPCLLGTLSLLLPHKYHLGGGSFALPVGFFAPGVPGLLVHLHSLKGVNQNAVQSTRSSDQE